MKKNLLPLMFIMAAFAVQSQLSAQNFTVTVKNNGQVFKSEKKYSTQAQAIFPQLSKLSFTGKGHADYRVEIIVDSPTVVNVINSTISVPRVTPTSLTGASTGLNMNPDLQYEKHQYAITYQQKVIIARLLDEKGAVVSEKQSAESPVFRTIYEKTFRIDGNTSNYNNVLSDYSPDKYYILFMNNTPPKGFHFDTSVEAALAGLSM